MSTIKPPLGASRPTTKHLVKHTGKGTPGATHAFEIIMRLEKEMPKYFKRRLTSNLFIAGQSAPSKEAPVNYSVVVYTDDAEELAYIRENA